MSDQPVNTTTGAQQTMESVSWYRQAAQKGQRLNILLGLMLLMSLTTNGLQLFFRPVPVYFGMTADLRLLPMPPLSSPVMSDAALKAWVAEAITTSFNLTYVDWRNQLSACREFFSAQHFAQFAQTLVAEGHIPLLEQKKAIMHAVPTGTPTIVKSGVLKGVRTWEIEVPLLVTYETSAGRVASNNLVVVVRVQRMPTTDYERGVAITQLIAMPAPAQKK